MTFVRGGARGVKAKHENNSAIDGKARNPTHIWCFTLALAFSIGDGGSNRFQLAASLSGRLELLAPIKKISPGIAGLVEQGGNVFDCKVRNLHALLNLFPR